MEEEAEAEEPVLLKPVATGRVESEKDGEDDEDDEDDEEDDEDDEDDEEGKENESWREDLSFLVFTKCFDLSNA